MRHDMGRSGTSGDAIVTLTRIRRLVYGLLGILIVAIGAAAMIVPLGWLPDGVTADVMAGLTPSPYLDHILQEFGTLAIAVGLVFLWLSARAEFVHGLHWLLTLYLALDALIHWVGPGGFTDSWSSGTLNTIPVALMLLIGVLEARRPVPAPRP